MIYKIIVDKQSRTNPSSEKREYTIDIEELRVKGDVYDSLVITKDEDYVMRRLHLSELQVLTVLEEPIKQPIPNLNIELFEGDNYIYLLDMTGNKFYAEYIVKNDFTDTYVTTNEMNSAINQLASQIELSVNQKLTDYSTTEEMNASINMKADAIKEEVSDTYATQEELVQEKSERVQTATQISEEVSKKVDKETITGAYLILKINGDTSEAKLNADKIELSANDILNLLAGNAINLTSKNIIISSNCFNLDKNGIITLRDSESIGAALQIISNDNSSFNSSVRSFGAIYNGPNGYVAIDADFAYSGGTIKVAPSENGDETNYTLIQNGSVNALTVSQRSLEKVKKNFEKLQSGLEIIKNTDIYKYNLKNEEDTTKKHIGFVIGDKYKYSKEITSNNNDGVDIYSFTSVCCKAIQEQQEQIENQNNLIQSLIERIEKLEAK